MNVTTGVSTAAVASVCEQIHSSFGLLGTGSRMKLAK